jgi:O-antigen/teichoic acid export membrane protein
LATLSRLQKEPDRFRAFFCRGIELMVTCGMPAVVFLFVSADTVVLTVLGEKWLEAVPIFRVLGPAAFLGTFNVATGWVFTSLGRTDRKFRWGLFASIVHAIGFFVGLPWGAIGVAASVSIVSCVLRVPSLVYAYHGTPVRVRDLGLAIWRPATAATLGGAFLFGVRTLWEPAMPIAASLVLQGIVYALGYVGTWILLPGGRQTLAGVLRLIREIRGNGTQENTIYRETRV